MNKYRIGVLYGDGIGPDISKATIDLLERTSAFTQLANFEFEYLPMGLQAISEFDAPLPEVTKQSLKNVDGWIMGPHDSASYPEKHKEKRNPSGELRHSFDLYANIRPTKSIPGVKSVVKGADLIIFRENTEGFYTDRNMYVGNGEWQITPDVVVSAGVFTRKAIERIAKAAFEMAMQRRKKLTIIHKANVLRASTGLFKQICLEIGKDFPEVTVDDYHIDAATALLVRRIDSFDVIVTENMFGDILSDLTGELNGSLGLAPSINTNENQAMAQAAHGSAPDIVGKNIANPVGIMLSTVMLLEWLGKRHGDHQLDQLANIMESAIFKALVEGICTPDLGGEESTTSFTSSVINNVKEKATPVEDTL